VGFVVSALVTGVSILIKSDRRPHYLVHMHDPVLAHNLREYSKQIWEELDKKRIKS